MINNIKNSTIRLNICVLQAKSFRERLFGLIFKRLKGTEVFLIKNCNSVHTFWMFRKIDIIFLDQNNKVISLFKDFKTFRFTPFIKNAVCVIEAESGFISKHDIYVDVILNLQILRKNIL
ncbi:DUF192 domain-containing protein [bacterium]|jgi:uncharacterized membrane protein (UPF0127 family)|nr:DUF192 domain-containing protein [bacterium]